MPQAHQINPERHKLAENMNPQQEVKTMEEIIATQPQEAGKLEELAILKSQMKDFEAQIECIEQTSGIAQLRKEKAKIEADYLVKLAKVGSSVTFSEDRFLKAIKRKGDSYREGTLKLIRNSTTRREVIREKFIAKYHDLALKICTIPVGKAETLIGESELDALCSRKTTYSYELINMEDYI